jgi:hypothetical protein
MKLIRARNLILALFVTLVLGPVAGAAGNLEAVVASYLEIQAQLAMDRMDGIKASAAAIAASAASMGESGKDIAAAAKSVEQAQDLKAARDAFAPLSNAVIAAAKAQGWQGLDDVKLAYCPMVADGYWLQKEDAIRNPYYGKKMQTCGEIRKKDERYP